jgi:hypothetical protein
MNKDQRKELIIEIVDKQIQENSPPETRETLDRLMSRGYSEQVAKELIGTVLVDTIHTILKTKTTFDKERYVKQLKKLPETPF